jgi:hypothetical protein
MHSDNYKNQPYFEDLERLKEMLDKLPKNPKKTAEMGWEDIEKGPLLSGPTGSFIRISGIKNIALAYKAVFEPGDTPHRLMDEVRRARDCREDAALERDDLTGELCKSGELPSKQDPPAKFTEPMTHCDIQEWLENAGNDIRKSFEKLKYPPPEVLYWLAQNEAVRPQPYWQTWFAIPEHWMGKEKDWDSHEINAGLLKQLTRELKRQAFLAGLHKQAPKGPRQESKQHAAKEKVIADLTRLVNELGGSGRHVNAIWQVIHKWATGEDVSIRSGDSAKNRVNLPTKPATQNKSEMRILFACNT